MFKTCILGFVWEFGREGRGREGYGGLEI